MELMNFSKEEPDLKSVLVCNQKGGVGKSLIADELAFAMERCGTPCNFYDLDNQGGTIHTTHEVDGAVVQIVDTPGALQRDIMQWMDDADIIVIPFRPTSRDIPPLVRMMEIADAHAKGKPVLYVQNAWNRYRASQDFHAWFKDFMKDRPDTPLIVVPQSEQFVQATAADKSVVDHAPRSTAATSIKQVSNWVRSMLGLRTEPVMPVEGV